MQFFGDLYSNNIIQLDKNIYLDIEYLTGLHRCMMNPYLNNNRLQIVISTSFWKNIKKCINTSGIQ